MFISTLRVVALAFWVLSSPLWGQTLETLYSFPADGSDGAKPKATLTIGPDGNLYGTATEGGANAAGSVFRVSIGGEVTVFNDFTTATTGRNPIARMINIGDGFLYGVTERNGNVAGDPEGTVYRLDPAAGLTPVFQLDANTSPFPSNPRALVSGQPNVLHILGYEPGGLWRVPLDGSPATIARVFNMNDRATEGTFHTSIIRGSDGLLYGGSYAGGIGAVGILFRVAPDGTGFTRLHSCEFSTGIRPVGAMVEGPDGNFYGTMEDGGEHNGVIFRLTPAGDYSVLHYFDDFRYPQGDLLLASDGFLYGTGLDSGPGGNGNGGVFRIRPNGDDYEVLHTFRTSSTAPLYPDGRWPTGGLVQAADGYLYGTTQLGGSGNVGTVFRIDLGLPANRPPIAVADFATSTGAPVAVNVKSNDYDADGEPLSVQIVSNPTFGTATVQAGGTIQYTPNDSYEGFDSLTYKVSDPRGGTSSALVTILASAPAALLEPGSYHGLLALSETEVPRGAFALKVEANGSFSGTLFSQKKRASFRGIFEDNATAVVEVNLPKQGRGILFLAFQAGEPNTIFAAFFGPEFWNGEAGPVTVSGSDAKQSFTVQIRSDDANPQLPVGRGYGVLTVNPNGTVSMVGKLGDGSNLSWSSTLTRQSGFAKVVPVYAEPVKGGVFAGLVFPDGAGFEGEARWVRPAARKPSLPYALGFSGSAAVRIAPFTPPSGTDPVLDFPDGIVALSGGPIAERIAGVFLVEGKKFTTDGPLRMLTINRKNGLFAGKMQVGRKTLTFRGAIDQGAKEGSGSVTVNGQTGAVELFRPNE